MQTIIFLYSQTADTDWFRVRTSEDNLTEEESWMEDTLEGEREMLPFKEGEKEVLPY